MIPLETPKWQFCLSSSDRSRQIIYYRTLQVSGVNTASNLESDSAALCLDPSARKRTCPAATG